MVDRLRDDLWREFPKTAQAFEARFKTEEDCRAYLMKARWGGKPACAKCKSTRVWPIRGGVRYECADCRHQTSLTSGTVFEKTRKGSVPGLVGIDEGVISGLSTKPTRRLPGHRRRRRHEDTYDDCRFGATAGRRGLA